MDGIVKFAIDNWRMTIGIMIFAVIGGLIAIDRLPLDGDPDVPVPFVNVQVILPGVSPEDSERLLVRPMETELKSIEGLKRMDGVSSTSIGYVVLEFNFPFDQDQALLDVNEAVDKARSEFPQEAQQPVVKEINTSNIPIVVVNLYGDAPERELQRRAKDIQRRIEGLPSVLAANISGERVDVLEAILDPALVESAGITFDEIAAAISRNNSLITAGAVETDNGRFGVKLPGLIERPEDLGALVIRRNANGSIVRLSEVSQIRKGYKDVTSYARFEGNKSVSIEVTKRQGENIILTIEEVRTLVDDIVANPEWPATVNMTYSQDRSREIIDMVTSLFSSIVNAVILVFIVCIAALGLRSALFVGWAVPASFLMALFMFLVQGETINMMIMFGLILSVGVLVDSAIVIVEFADRKLAEGLPRREAFLEAGQRMFWPIISSTATTLAAFIPLLFWESVPGKYMSYFPLTMIYVLSASLLMALIFLPTMGTLIGPRKITKPTENLRAVSGKGGDPLKTKGLLGIYVRVINTLIRFPEFVILATLVLAFVIFKGFTGVMSGPNPKPVEFFTNSAGEQVYILARSRGNNTALSDLQIALDIERRIDGIDGIQSVYTVTGSAAGGSGGVSMTGPNNVPSDTIVKVYTELLPFAMRPPTADIIADIRESIAGIPGIFTEVVSIANGPPIGKDMEVQLTADDPELLQTVTRKVRQKFESLEGLFEVEDTLPLPGIEWEMTVNQAEAGRLGLDVSRIGAAVQLITEGTLAAQYRPLDNDEEVDIRIRYPQSSRDLRELQTLRIQTPQGSVPLTSVVDIKAKPKLDQINRRDQLRVYEVKANTRDGYATNQQVAIVKKWLETEADIPAGVNVKFLGQEEENAEAGRFFEAAGVAILFMMGIILLLQFNSFYHVFLTLLAVILSLFGVLLGLTFYSYISIILCGTGVIALAGIVVNNNIVLIDAYQNLLRNGYDPIDAAVRTAAQRVRPVFLTTLTTVAGLMPLVLGWQADIFSGEFSTRGTSTSEIWAPISYVITCGLAFATGLTLILTPVLLAAPTIWKQRITLLWRKMRPEKMQVRPAE